MRGRKGEGRGGEGQEGRGRGGETDSDAQLKQGHRLAMDGNSMLIYPVRLKCRDMLLIDINCVDLDAFTGKCSRRLINSKINIQWTCNLTVMLHSMPLGSAI